MWGPVLYTNTLSVPLMLGVAITTGEPARLAAVSNPNPNPKPKPHPQPIPNPNSNQAGGRL